MSKVELLPCPFCSATEGDDCIHVVPYGEPGLVLYKVVCTCGATNEGGFNEADVVSAWNTRADPATHRALGRAEGYAQCQGEVVAWLRAQSAELGGVIVKSVIADLATAIEQSAQGDGG